MVDDIGQTQLARCVKIDCRARFCRPLLPCCRSYPVNGQHLIMSTSRHRHNRKVVLESFLWCAAAAQARLGMPQCGGCAGENMAAAGVGRKVLGEFVNTGHIRVMLGDHSEQICPDSASSDRCCAQPGSEGALPSQQVRHKALSVPGHVTLYSQVCRIFLRSRRAAVGRPPT